MKELSAFSDQLGSDQQSAFSDQPPRSGHLGEGFRELKVWHKAHDLALTIYRITAAFPRAEQFGFTSQLRRCAASIGANLAEGCGRNGDAELSRFCSIAMGSASELEYHLLLAKDTQLLDSKGYKELSDRATEVKRMLAALIKKLNADRRTLPGTTKK